MRVQIQSSAHNKPPTWWACRGPTSWPALRRVTLPCTSKLATSVVSCNRLFWLGTNANRLADAKRLANWVCIWMLKFSGTEFPGASGRGRRHVVHCHQAQFAELIVGQQTLELESPLNPNTSENAPPSTPKPASPQLPDNEASSCCETRAGCLRKSALHAARSALSAPPRRQATWCRCVRRSQRGARAAGL